MDQFIEQIVTGLSIGSILLLVALGLSIIYGSMGIINLAHGEFVMLGAYAAWVFHTYLGLGLLASLVPIFLVVATFGWVIERYVLSLLNNRPLDTILATWGVGIMLQQAVRLMVGSELRYVQLPPALADSMDVFGIPISSYRVFLFVVSIALFGATWLLMNRTTVGMKLRAIIQDRSVAASFGINAKRVYALTFAYGAGLAGLAGALVSPLKSVSPDMGTGYVVDAFMVVVLGGVQSLAGTVASAFILGELSGGIAFLQNDTVAKTIVLLAIVVLIRFRPEGLFTARVRA
ncbi:MULTISPECIES: urea ABC transporter permease subunit UrtB [unclassified Bradyrhizobium]|uniref:urea ABC transporter permease subunit UrtB n=1 Tax=unclassified Bradyrhizobium TaxID=2631580 RepID=UPI001BA71882|nr:MULTISPECIES: urea ABC transporter permease subunit UrtB [unclassified Bradyrhizobium]MBR1202585.1 urea ABC transporter permease subunit UrtB [Bradyrhizobium sp. AUGA SZCCT0124]MBR1310846.1 urea ABC transporter permease subunit UrtB [Bradyrhizobium sp. AUGA SZCCT0051]MBR1339534.1 urea ABC transporter permease subunit UrtB [Bradyrhizobium sp. AUGA SZCCT0105]MBR1354108.1 urea ABC transporter permease subunit UrtB [Bradyrhizobium sp. AUGA SZCCT0045]